MKPKSILIVSVFFFTLIFFHKIHAHSGNDSLGRKHSLFISKTKLFITTYASTIFTGDVSLGTELFYKCFGQEIALSYKCLKVLPKYKFDDGVTFRYDVKYSFLQRRNHIVNFSLSYIYTQKSFQDKVIPYMNSNRVYIAEFGEASMYLSNWKETRSGLGIGISNLSRVYKHFFIGVNLGLYLTNYKFHYIAKEHVSGHVVEVSEKSGSGYVLKPITTPYEVKYEIPRKSYLNILLKIAYCL